MSTARSAWLQWLFAERGACLWVPALWVAAALLLFGIGQARTDRTFYNHTLDLRVAVGPFDADEAGPAAAAAFLGALRDRLQTQRGFTVVPDELIRRRVETLAGGRLPAEPQRWMRATRNLNVSVYVTGRLAPSAQGVDASVALWNVGTEEEFARFDGGSASAPALGRALADSVGQALFAPAGSLHATR